MIIIDAITTRPSYKLLLWIPKLENCKSGDGPGPVVEPDHDDFRPAS
jgi:hypothetical protein